MYCRYQSVCFILFIKHLKSLWKFILVYVDVLGQSWT